MLYAIAAVVVIILDQWFKYWITGHIIFGSGTAVDLIPGVVSLVNVHNTGAAFGFMEGGKATIGLIIVAGVFAVIVILAIATNLISSRFGKWCAALVAAGGLSNCLDRIICGYVQDMFRFDFVNFAVFNIADIFITVFCILFIVDLIFGGEKGLFRRKDDDEDEEEEEEQEEEEEEDDDEDDYERPARKPLFSRGAKAKQDAYDDEDEDEDEPVRQTRSTRSAVTRESARSSQRAAETPKPVKDTRKTRQAKYEDDYAQLKAARAARQANTSSIPVLKTTPLDPQDPFAEWEKANARINAEQASASVSGETQVFRVQEFETPKETVKAAPVEAPKPAPAAIPEVPAVKPEAAPKKSSSDFDLDDILNEFKF